MIERLTGGSNKIQINSKPPGTNTSSNKNIGKFNNSKPSMSAPKKDNTKDILNRMKEVKAQYNTRSKNSAAKEQGITAKIA